MNKDTQQWYMSLNEDITRLETYIRDSQLISFFYNKLSGDATRFDTSFPYHAAVDINKDYYGTYHYELIINPYLFFSLENHMRIGILIHEFDHVILNHGQRKLELMISDPTFSDDLFGLAVDMVVNKNVDKYVTFTESGVFVCYEMINKRFPGMFRHKSNYNQFIEESSIEDIYFKLKSRALRQKGDIPLFTSPGITQEKLDDLFPEIENNNLLDEDELDEDELDEDELDEDELDEDVTIERRSNVNPLEEKISSGSGSYGNHINEKFELLQDVYDDLLETLVDDFVDDKVKKALEKNTSIDETSFTFKDKVFIGVEKLQRMVLDRTIIINAGNPYWRNIVISQKKKVKKDVDGFDWIGFDRKKANLPKEYLLPNYSTTPEFVQRPKIFIFVDISGSCADLVPKFNRLVSSIPTDLAVECYTFDTTVRYMGDPRKVKYVPRVGGGTEFGRIVEKVLEIEKRDNKLPEYVIVMTDGQTNSFGMTSEARHILDSDPMKYKLNFLNWNWVYTGSYAEDESSGRIYPSTLYVPYRPTKVVLFDDLVTYTNNDMKRKANYKKEKGFSRDHSGDALAFDIEEAFVSNDMVFLEKLYVWRCNHY